MIDERIKKRKSGLDRMYEEISIMDGKYDDFVLKIESMIKKFAVSKGKFVTIQGCAAYLYSCYSLGLTPVNPLEYGYLPEAVFGYHHDRVPYVPVYVPEGFENEILAFVISVAGDNYTCRMDGFHTILIEGVDEERGNFMIPLVVSPVHSFIDRIIKSEKDMDDFRKSLNLFASNKNAFRDACGCEDDMTKYIKFLINIQSKVDREITDHVDEFLSEVLDDTPSGVINAISAIHGNGVWPNSKTKIYSFDEAIRFGLEHFDNNAEDAYRFADILRKGHTESLEFKEIIEKYGLPEDIVEDLRKIRHLVQEGDGVITAFIICALASVKAL